LSLVCSFYLEREIKDYQKLEGIIFFLFLNLYFPFVPLSLDMIEDIFALIDKYIFERRLRKKNEKLNNLVNITDSSFLYNLGLIDQVFIDKTGTLTKGNYKIDSLFIWNKVFLFEDKNSINVIFHSSIKII